MNNEFPALMFSWFYLNTHSYVPNSKYNMNENLPADLVMLCLKLLFWLPCQIIWHLGN